MDASYQKLAGAQEQEHKGEEGKRLDECQAEEQEELNAGASARVTSQCLCCRRGSATLTETAKASGDAHADTDG